jgi:XrtJ-associated TM-motif-TM protein
MMKKHALLLMVVFLSLATPLFADDGCDDSPEGPTIVLALAGFAGIAGVQARNLFRKQK